MTQGRFLSFVAAASAAEETARGEKHVAAGTQPGREGGSKEREEKEKGRRRGEGGGGGSEGRRGRRRVSRGGERQRQREKGEQQGRILGKHVIAVTLQTWVRKIEGIRALVHTTSVMHCTHSRDNANLSHPETCARTQTQTHLARQANTNTSMTCTGTQNIHPQSTRTQSIDDALSMQWKTSLNISQQRFTRTGMQHVTRPFVCVTPAGGSGEAARRFSLISSARRETWRETQSGVS